MYITCMLHVHVCICDIHVCTHTHSHTHASPYGWLNPYVHHYCQKGNVFLCTLFIHGTGRTGTHPSRPKQYMCTSFDYIHVPGSAWVATALKLDWNCFLGGKHKPQAIQLTVVLELKPKGCHSQYLCSLHVQLMSAHILAKCVRVCVCVCMCVCTADCCYCMLN